MAEKVCELHPPTAEGELCATMMWSLATFFHVLDQSGRWMTPEQQKLALRCGNLYLLSYQALATVNQNARRYNYKVRPKQHYFSCGLLTQIEASFLNPRFTHCFLDEDFMGRISRLAKHSPGRSTTYRTIQRWVLFMSQRWEQLCRATR